MTREAKCALQGRITSISSKCGFRLNAKGKWPWPIKSVLVMTKKNHHAVECFCISRCFCVTFIKSRFGLLTTFFFFWLLVYLGLFLLKVKVRMSKTCSYTTNIFFFFCKGQICWCGRFFLVRPHVLTHSTEEEADGLSKEWRKQWLWSFLMWHVCRSEW